jgi:hypothetical protein
LYHIHSQQTACSGVCSEAVNVPSLPATLAGNTELTDATDNYGLSTCDVDAKSRIEFYKMIGTGVCVLAEVNTMAFTPAIVVYTGACVDLQCFTKSYSVFWGFLSGEEGVEKGKSTIIPTEAGTEYTIGITGTSVDQVGTYDLSLVRLDPLYCVTLYHLNSF